MNKINIGDKIIVTNFQEQSIGGDMAADIARKGFSTVSQIDNFGGTDYITILEYPDLIIWKYIKKY